MRAAILVVLVACSGDSDGNAVENLETCGAGWETLDPQTSLSGLCHEECKVFPAETGQSCLLDLGEPIECRNVGGRVVNGGCCRPRGRVTDQGATVFDVAFYECE